MILFYLLVSVMPMMKHPLWSDLIGDLTVVKYLGMACFVFAVLYLGVRRSPPMFFGTWQARWFLMFALLGMASFTAWGPARSFEVSPMMSLLSFLVFFFVTMVVVDSPDRFRWSILVAIGSVAYASLHILREWQKYGGMSFGYRPGWVTGDPNYFSVSALLCLPLAYYLLRTKQPLWERAFCAGSLVLILAAVTLAGSRGAFLGLTAGAAVIVWRSESRRRTAMIACAVLLPLMVLTPASPLDRLLNPTRSDNRSTDIRQALWGAGMRMVQEYPLTGVGLGNFKPVVQHFAGPDDPRLSFIAHNTYVEVAAELGVPGFLLFAAVIVSTFASLQRIRRETAQDKSSLPYQVSQGMQSGLVAFLVAAFFVSAEYQKLFWLFVFLSAALPALVPSQKAVPAGPALGQVTAARRPVRPGFRPAVVAALIAAGLLGSASLASASSISEAPGAASKDLRP